MSDAKGKSSTVTKSISLPADLFNEADERVHSEDDLDWSKYVRRLIRADLKSVKQPLLPHLAEKEKVVA